MKCWTDMPGVTRWRTSFKTVKVLARADMHAHEGQYGFTWGWYGFMRAGCYEF